MFKYRGCKGIKTSDNDGGFFWMITFEDGTHDMAVSLYIAIALCNKELRRASF